MTAKTKRHIIYEMHTVDSRDKKEVEKILSESTKSKSILPENIKIQNSVRYVRLLIHSPATEWGSSIWRLQIWGIEA